MWSQWRLLRGPLWDKCVASGKTVSSQGCQCSEWHRLPSSPLQRYLWSDEKQVYMHLFCGAEWSTLSNCSHIERHPTSGWAVQILDETVNLNKPLSPEWVVMCFRRSYENKQTQYSLVSSSPSSTTCQNVVPTATCGEASGSIGSQMNSFKGILWYNEKIEAVPHRQEATWDFNGRWKTNKRYAMHIAQIAPMAGE